MNVFSVLSEIWRDILSGVSRAASFAMCVFLWLRAAQVWTLCKLLLSNVR